MSKQNKKTLFENFIKQYIPEEYERVLPIFENYYQELLDANAKVNLISRKTPPEDLWTLHLLDSILPIEHFNFNGKRILDFGSGGGLPGIPLKIIFPSSEVYLLDSRLKKMVTVKNIIKNLDLKECFTIVSRLEELASEWFNSFDVIVCRSVRILPEYKKLLLKLLKKDGKIILYKSKILDDVEQFSKKQIIEVSHPEIGERKLIVINK